MSDVLRATYADLKTVKTRSTCQLILELPIEALTDVVALLGAPVPGNEVWVAVARLREGAAPQPALEEPKRGTLAQQAGILCSEGRFQRFAIETLCLDHGGEEEAKRLIYDRCQVTSRRDLDRDDAAAERFRYLRGEYDLWCRA